MKPFTLIAASVVFASASASASVEAPMTVANGGLDYKAYVVYQAMQNPDGSYYWQSEPDPASKSFLLDDVSSTINYVLTGGMGTATIYLPISISALASHAATYGPTAAVISNTSTGTADLDFEIFGISKIFTFKGTQTDTTPVDLLFPVDVPYNTIFNLNVGVYATVNTNPADDNVSLCGTPSATNLECSLSSSMEVSTSFVAPYFEIPYGTNLTETNLGKGLQYAVLNVPEPSEYVLMLAGLGGIIGFTRRKRRV